MPVGLLLHRNMPHDVTQLIFCCRCRPERAIHGRCKYCSCMTAINTGTRNLRLWSL